jgi:hypothetical protein
MLKKNYRDLQQKFSMRKLIYLSSVCLGLFVVGCSPSAEKKSDDGKNAEMTEAFDFDTNTLQAGETFYQCPMDPEIISDKTGTCPKCEMDLEPVVKS